MVKQIFPALAFAILTSLTATPVFAQSDASDVFDIQPVPLVPVDPTEFDFTGVWEYVTSGHTVSGVCNAPGNLMSGLLDIQVAGGVVSLKLVSGAVCDPASMCDYTGEVGAGYLLVSNTGTVDDEGGEVTNALQLFFLNENQGFGQGGSYYLHPKGYECRWSYDFYYIHPELDEDGNPKLGVSSIYN